MWLNILPKWRLITNCVLRLVPFCPVPFSMLSPCPTTLDVFLQPKQHIALRTRYSFTPELKPRSHPL